MLQVLYQRKFDFPHDCGTLRLNNHNLKLQWSCLSYRKAKLLLCYVIGSVCIHYNVIL